MTSTPPSAQTAPTAHPNKTARLLVRRDSEADVQQRQIVIYVDGERKGEILFGEELDTEISAGHHRMRVDNTWNWKNLEIEARAGETLEFRVTSKAGRFSWFLSAVGAGPMYVEVERIGPRAAKTSQDV